jgi:hypothetical protein
MPRGIPSSWRQISTTAADSPAAVIRNVLPDSNCALDEQRRRRRFDTVLQIKRWHCPEVLVGNPKPFAAGGKDIHGLRVRKDCFYHVRRGVENMLAIVKDQQPRPAFQRGGHGLTYGLAGLLGDAQHRGHRVGH